MTTPRRSEPLLVQQTYRGPKWWSFGLLRGARTSAGMRRIAAVYVALNAATLATGIANAALGWNGVQLPFGPAWLSITIFPPLLLSVVAALWLGPTWGIVPAYLGNLVSALWSGIPWSTSLVFALAGALETAVVWGSMVTLNISPDLQRAKDVARFAALSLIAPAVSSLSVLIWNTSLGLSFVEGQRVWRGWVVGDFLQLTLVAVPLFRWVGPVARGWIDRQFATPPNQDAPHVRAAAFASVIVGLMGALFLVGMLMLRGTLDVPPDTRTTTGELLAPRLQEVEFFVTLVVVALVLTTAVFSNGLARVGERQRSRALHDSLTGVLNRRAFYERFVIEADRSRRLGKELSLLFADVDYFKSINDRFGHEVGDHVLQRIAVRLQEAIRDTDLLFRWGGEEFVVLLAHTSLVDAQVLAERLRAAIADRPFPAIGDTTIDVTISLGVAATERSDADPDVLVGRADAACLRVKQTGRDAVAVDGHVRLEA